MSENVYNSPLPRTILSRARGAQLAARSRVSPARAGPRAHVDVRHARCRLSQPAGSVAPAGRHALSRPTLSSVGL